MALNFTQQYEAAKKQNPNLKLEDFQKEYQVKSPENKTTYEAAVKKNQQTAQVNQQKAQESYLKSGGTLKKGEVYDPYATLRGMAEQRAQGVENPKAQTTFSAEEANQLRGKANQQGLQYQPATQDYNVNPQENAQNQPLSEIDSLQQKLQNQEQLTAQFKKESISKRKELGQVSGQVADFGKQLQEQQQQVQDLVNSLNSKQQGLGDHVNSILQDMAASGVQANLTPESLQVIQDMAENTPPDQLQQLDQKISQISQTPQEKAPQQPQQPLPEVQPQELPPPPAQQYQNLKSSGMSAAQILQQNPNLSKQVVPDGSILNPNTGVNIVQTALGESYKTPSGLLIPKDSSTGFYNLSALTPDQITKLSFADLMSIDLATQKTSSDMKAFYSAQTFQKMAQRNDREYGMAQLDLQSYYDAQSNRLNESKLKDTQDLELERMRQELSKDTSIQSLNEQKSKAANMMKAQMDAWGLEGSSVMVTAMISQSNKFEQEISNVKKSYDINIMELTMASTQSQMQYVNRVTELNQDMQSKKMKLADEYLNRKDEIDDSLLLSKIAQKEEKDNAYRDYVMKVTENEQQSQAAAAEAAKAAQDDLWEKQKYYTEQMGVMISIGPDGSINPLLDEEGNPVQTMEGQKFQWEQDKYATDYDLRVQQFQQDQYEFGIDADLRQAQFQQNVQQFGMDYALRQDKQFFDQNMDQMKFNQADEQFYAQMSGYDIKVDENGDYIGTNKMGQIVNFGNGVNVAIPNKSKFEYNVVGSDEIRFNIPEGKMKVRGECGQLVNDALFGGPGGGGMGDSFESKMALNNSPRKPVAGGAFIEKINGLATGHTGLVEKVYPDGSFDIRESNYEGKWVVSTDTIHPGEPRWTSIVENGGFYDPIKGGTGKKKGGGSNNSAQSIAKDIFNGNSNLKLTNLPQNQRAAVDAELSKMKNAAKESGDLVGQMKASVGGAAVSETAIQQFAKTASVINQLQGLTSALNDKGKLTQYDASPLTGFIKKKNPWSAEGQEINAMLQSTIPNLARGVYGEVGVLTDQDVELYRKTLPNLSQPALIQKSITAMTLRSLKNSMENQLKSNMAFGKDVSGAAQYYQEINDKLTQMESELGINSNGTIKNSNPKNQPPSLLSRVFGTPQGMIKSIVEQKGYKVPSQKTNLPNY